MSLDLIKKEGYNAELKLVIPAGDFEKYCNEAYNKNKSKINDGLLQSITKSTNIKAYKEAGFNFAYTCRSQKNPRLILFEGMYTQKDYDK